MACRPVGLSACGGGSKTTSNPDPIVNAAPVVNAGTDATIRLQVDNVVLDGTVTDDGQPAGAVVSTAWTVKSESAGATFADANAIDTTVTFVSEGTYVLELTADDTALQGNDTVQVIVEAAPNDAICSHSRSLAMKRGLSSWGCRFDLGNGQLAPRRIAKN